MRQDRRSCLHEDTVLVYMICLVGSDCLELRVASAGRHHQKQNEDAVLAV